MISVIVPVYKVEEYLDKCVASIVNQTYTDLEIILVDDGSPDNCPAMCDEWAKRDSRIKVIHQENGGLSAARNSGLSVAKGEYIAFVDSDDWISTDFIEYLYTKLLENECDIAECDYVVCCGSESNYNTESSSDDTVCCETEDVLRHNISGSIFKDVVWNKLYRRCLITIPFEVGKQHEDVFWTYKIYANSKRCVHSNKKLYFYLQRKGSIMADKYTVKRLDSVQATENKSKFIVNHYPNLAPLAQYNMSMFCMYNVQRLLESDIVERRSIARDLHTRSKAIGFEWKKSNIFPLKHKIWLRLFLHFPIITCELRNILEIGK